MAEAGTWRRRCPEQGRSPLVSVHGPHSFTNGNQRSQRWDSDQDRPWRRDAGINDVSELCARLQTAAGPSDWPQHIGPLLHLWSTAGTSNKALVVKAVSSCVEKVLAGGESSPQRVGAEGLAMAVELLLEAARMSEEGSPLASQSSIAHDGLASLTLALDGAAGYAEEHLAGRLGSSFAAVHRYLAVRPESVNQEIANLLVQASLQALVVSCPALQAPRASNVRSSSNRLGGPTFRSGTSNRSASSRAEYSSGSSDGEGSGSANQYITLRLTALTTLQGAIKANRGAFRPFWDTLLALPRQGILGGGGATRTAPSSVHTTQISLCSVLQQDPVSKVRQVAAVTMAALLESSSQQAYLRLATSSSRTKSYVSLSERIGTLIEELHHFLLDVALRRERNPRVVSATLRVLSTLSLGTPYNKLEPHLFNRTAEELMGGIASTIEKQSQLQYWRLQDVAALVSCLAAVLSWNTGDGTSTSMDLSLAGTVSQKLLNLVLHGCPGRNQSAVERKNDDPVEAQPALQLDASIAFRGLLRHALLGKDIGHSFVINCQSLAERTARLVMSLEEATTAVARAAAQLVGAVGDLVSERRKDSHAVLGEGSVTALATAAMQSCVPEVRAAGCDLVSVMLTSSLCQPTTIGVVAGDPYVKLTHPASGSHEYDNDVNRSLVGLLRQAGQDSASVVRSAAVRASACVLRATSHLRNDDDSAAGLSHGTARCRLAACAEEILEAASQDAVPAVRFAVGQSFHSLLCCQDAYMDHKQQSSRLWRCAMLLARDSHDRSATAALQALATALLEDGPTILGACRAGRDDDGHDDGDGSLSSTNAIAAYTLYETLEMNVVGRGKNTGDGSTMSGNLSLKRQWAAYDVAGAWLRTTADAETAQLLIELLCRAMEHSTNTRTKALAAEHMLDWARKKGPQNATAAVLLLPRLERELELVDTVVNPPATPADWQNRRRWEDALGRLVEALQCWRAKLQP